MEYLRLLGVVLAATAVTHLMNILSIRWLEATNPVWSSIKAAAIMIPLSFVATALYSLFYSTGSQQIPYITLSVVAIAISLVLGAAVQGWLIHSRALNMYDAAGLLFVSIGILFFVLAKK